MASSRRLLRALAGYSLRSTTARREFATVAAPEDILDEFCSGRATLDAARRALARAAVSGAAEAQEVSGAISRYVEEGRLSADDAARLAEQAAPEPEQGLTLLRPSGSTDPMRSRPAAAPTGGAAPSGNSSGWRQWAASEKEPVPSVGVGTVLRDRFVIEEIVGEGGMGLVFRARDRRREEANDRNPFVAIKVLGDDFKTHPDSLIALQREARRMQQLSHPNIASVYDFDRDATHVFLVMELLEGESLDHLLARHKETGLPLDLARKVIECAGGALRHAHTRGLVHSDFKPANVFVSRTGEIKVIDFGIARIAKDATQIGDAAYTLFDAGKLGAYTNSYASPEQMLEGSMPDPKDDIYALGLVAYEALSGRHPFGRKSAIDAKFRGMTVEPLPMLDARQNAVLASALDFDREKRLGDILELVRALAPESDEAIRATDRIGSGRTVAADEPAVQRRKGWRLAAFAAVGIAWLAFFWIYWSSRDEGGEKAVQPSVTVEDSGSAPAQSTSQPADVAGVPAPAVQPPREPVAKAVAQAPPSAAPSTVASTDSNTGEKAGASPVVPEESEARRDASAAEAAPPASVAQEAKPDQPASEAPAEAGKHALYRWVDANGTVQFGESPPEEYAASAVKVLDL
jgi:tRNA A-37 threonylcarbamoyl transferase component Bud32